MTNYKTQTVQDFKVKFKTFFYKKIPLNAFSDRQIQNDAETLTQKKTKIQNMAEKTKYGHTQKNLNLHFTPVQFSNSKSNKSRSQ